MQIQYVFIHAGTSTIVLIPTPCCLTSSRQYPPASRAAPLPPFVINLAHCSLSRAKTHQSLSHTLPSLAFSPHTSNRNTATMMHQCTKMHPVLVHQTTLENSRCNVKPSQYLHDDHSAQQPLPTVVQRSFPIRGGTCHNSVIPPLSWLSSISFFNYISSLWRFSGFKLLLTWTSSPSSLGP